MASRVSTLESIGLTYYDWDGINVIQEKDSSNQVTDRQVHGYAPIVSVGDIALMDISGNTAVLVPDQTGTTHKVLGESGAVANAYQYDAFGVARAATEALSCLYRYSGHRLARDEGFYGPEVAAYLPETARSLNRNEPYTGPLIDPNTPHQAQRPGVPSSVPGSRWDKTTCRWMDDTLRDLMLCLLGKIRSPDDKLLRFAQGLQANKAGRQPPAGGVPVLVCDSKDPTDEGEWPQGQYGYVIVSSSIAYSACGSSGAYLLRKMVHEWTHMYYDITGASETYGGGGAIIAAEETQVKQETERAMARRAAQLVCCSSQYGTLWIDVTGLDFLLAVCGKVCRHCPEGYYTRLVPTDFLTRGILEGAYLDAGILLLPYF